MAIIHVTEATVGAPNSGRMSGTAGDLYAMLKYALPLNGWAVEYDDAVNFGAVFRPGTGNRFRLFVLDNATASGDARLALVRGCENASGATMATIIDPFPTVAKIADNSSNWMKSTTVNTTARNFNIYVGETWVMFFCNISGLTNIWEMGLYGDWPATLSGDSYNTVCAIRAITTATAPSANGVWGAVSGQTGNTSYSWARDYGGTVKATSGGISSQSTGAFGLGGGTAALVGPSTGIDRCKMVSMDTGSITISPSASLGLAQRGYVPNLWLPLHAGRGTVNSRDTFTDTNYNPSATFCCFCIGNAASSGFVIVEETDTWSPP